jgi:uncharacterized membrane protein
MHPKGFSRSDRSAAPHRRPGRRGAEDDREDLRVCVPSPINDPIAAAERRFNKLGLSRLHEHRASVLLYIAPKTHKFAILGDTAIHQRCGEDYWKQLADRLSRDLKAGDLTAALLNAIASLKGTLEEHFPA